MGTKLVEDILTALDEQTVTVPGTTAADTVLPRLAAPRYEDTYQRGGRVPISGPPMQPGPVTALPDHGFDWGRQLCLAWRPEPVDQEPPKR